MDNHQDLNEFLNIIQNQLKILKSDNFNIPQRVRVQTSINDDDFKQEFFDLEIPVPNIPEKQVEQPVQHESKCDRYLTVPFCLEANEIDSMMDISERKRINKCLNAVPDNNVSNPIAAVTNFVNHHLKAKIIFDISTIPSNNPSEPIHIVKVFLDEKEICEFSHKRKKHAKEQAAKQTIKYLNNNRDYVIHMAKISVYNKNR